MVIVDRAEDDRAVENLAAGGPSSPDGKTFSAR
jgi:hypothetical protein